MIYPTIHINGTSRQVLLDQLCAAGAAIQDASYALSAAAPNGRDYYPQGNGAFAQAVAEHSARRNALANVYGELMTIAKHIDEQP